MYLRWIVVLLGESNVQYTGWAKKTDNFQKVYNFSYNDIRRRSIYQNVQLFIRSKNDILNGDIQNISFTPDKELNILIYRTPSYVIILSLIHI